MKLIQSSYQLKVCYDIIKKYYTHFYLKKTHVCNSYRSSFFLILFKSQNIFVAQQSESQRLCREVTVSIPGNQINKLQSYDSIQQLPPRVSHTFLSFKSKSRKQPKQEQQLISWTPSTFQMQLTVTSCTRIVSVRR